MTHKAPSPEDDHDRGVRNEERLCANDEKWVAHAVVHELEAQALRLQHQEYERRLQDLNHEAARINAANAANVSREVYDAEQKEVARRAAALAEALPTYVTREIVEAQARAYDGRVKALEDWRNKATGAAVILTLVAGAVGAAIAKALGA